MDLFQSCDHCWVFQIYSHYVCHSSLLFFSSLWVAHPAVMGFDLMWLHPSYWLIVASPLYITLSKIFWNLIYFIPKWKHKLVTYRKKSKSISITWKTPQQAFFPYQHTPLSSSHVYFQCCLYLDCHHSQIMEPLKTCRKDLFSLWSISCVFQLLPIVRKWQACPSFSLLLYLVQLLLWHYADLFPWISPS